EGPAYMIDGVCYPCPRAGKSERLNGAAGSRGERPRLRRIFPGVSLAGPGAGIGVGQGIGIVECGVHEGCAVRTQLPLAGAERSVITRPIPDEVEIELYGDGGMRSEI